MDGSLRLIVLRQVARLFSHTGLESLPGLIWFVETKHEGRPLTSDPARSMPSCDLQQHLSRFLFQ